MCAACGTTESDWTERVAPLRPGSAARRARVVTTLLRALPGTGRRVTVAPWPGGGIRWRGPSGWCFARSLPEAVRTLARRYGALVPTPEGLSPSAGERSLPFSITAEAAVVWCTAVLEAGWATSHACTLRLHDQTVVMRNDHTRRHEQPHTHPSLWVPYEPTDLLALGDDAARLPDQRLTATERPVTLSVHSSHPRPR